MKPLETREVPTPTETYMALAADPAVNAAHANRFNLEGSRCFDCDRSSPVCRCHALVQDWVQKVLAFEESQKLPPQAESKQTDDRLPPLRCKCESREAGQDFSQPALSPASSRNTIAHSTCVGVSNKGKRKGAVVFMPLKAHFGAKDKIVLYGIEPAHMAKAAKWANAWTDSLKDHYDALLTQPLSPPSKQHRRQDRPSSIRTPRGKTP